MNRKKPIAQFIDKYKERMENYDIKIETGIHPLQHEDKDLFKHYFKLLFY